MTKPRLQVQTMKTSDLIPYARNNVSLFSRKYAVENARKHKFDLSKTSRRVKTASFVIRKHQ